MSAKTDKPTLRSILLELSPAAVVALVFFASVPWLKDLNDAVVWAVTAAAAVSVLGWSMFVARRVERRSGAA